MLAHPEWGDRFSIKIPPYGIGVVEAVRFFLEIPSVHPTIIEPLTVEVADFEPGGPIDIYWGSYFEHIFMGKLSVEDQFARVLETVDKWMDESFVFTLSYDGISGRQSGWGRYPAPIDPGIIDRARESGKQLTIWSWQGTHDIEWSGE